MVFVMINVKSVIRKTFNAKSSISADVVNDFLAILDGAKATSDLSYDATLVDHGKFIQLQANISVSLELLCQRCGTLFPLPYSADITLKLVDASSIGSSDEIALSDDDLDTVTYLDNQIDLDHILLESVFLDLDGNCICREDCKGICTLCGQNLNLGSCTCAPD